MLRTLLVPGLLVAAMSDASADVARCAAADVDLSWKGTDFVELRGDTGWFPADFPAQLRLTGQVAGHTTIDAGMRTTACWGDAMQASLAGREARGAFDVAYGAELKLFGRIDTTVLGYLIQWEGEIPIPALPEDLLLAGTSTFDPSFDPTGAVSVTDATDPIMILSSNVLTGLIGVVGISGGINVKVNGEMTTTYQPRQATIAETALTSPGDRVSIPAPAQGFEGALELPVTIEGMVRYEPRLVFAAYFDVKIFGVRVVDWQLFDVPMSLPAVERPLTLGGSPARVPLPELDGLGDGARMDFASAPVQELRVRNFGEGPLELEATSLPAGVTMERVAIPANGTAALRVTASEGAFADGSVSLVLATNDPDRPSLAIELGVDIGGTDGGDHASAGCATTRGDSLALCVLVVVVGLRRRRGH